MGREREGRRGRGKGREAWAKFIRGYGAMPRMSQDNFYFDVYNEIEAIKTRSSMSLDNTFSASVALPMALYKYVL